MNIGKSLKVALAIKDMRQGDLASRMGVSNAYVSAIATNKKSVNAKTLSHICSILEYRVSEFIALGEDRAA